MQNIWLRFPGGRYHATPWGHHVNEGQIEWPPGPWRLLRAFIATGYAKLLWDDVPDIGRRLIEQLAGVLPEYLLPSASSAHSRHYMPTGKIEKGREKTTLVFDTWANVGDGELIVRWPCELDSESSALFRQLVENLGYLGRSESWVEAEVVSDDVAVSAEESPWRKQSFPVEGRDYPGPEYEQIQLMAATNKEAYAEWRSQQTNRLLAEHPLPEGKKKPTKTLLKQRDAAVAPYPRDLIDCLQKDTSWWKNRHRWSQPPGSQRVLYWRRNDALVVSHPRRSSRPEPKSVAVMLVALSTSTRNSSALPSVTRTLPQAELFHQAIVSRAGRGDRVHCPELTGTDEFGRPLKHDHQHAHVLPLDLDRNGHLDHILIWAPMGLGGSAQQAIRTLKSTWTKKGDDLQVALVGRGSVHRLRRLPDSLIGGIDQLLAPPKGDRCWISQTPYIAPRFVKKNGKNSLEGQIESELASRYGAKLTAFEIISPNGEGNHASLASHHRHFIRIRNRRGRRPPVDTGYTVHFEVSEQIHGPICLGYASHFGMGLFAATD